MQIKTFLLMGYGAAALAALFALIFNKRFHGAWDLVLATTLMVLHTWIVAFGFWRGSVGSKESLMLYAWLLMSGFFWLRQRIRTPLLAVFIFGGNFLLILASFSSPLSEPSGPAARSPLFPLHLLSLVFGGGLFGLAGLLAVFFLMQLRQLKERKNSWWLKRLPALETLEKILDHALRIGFALMTVGLLTGAFWAHEYFAAHWRWDANQVWSLLTWGLYGLAIYLRGTKNFVGQKGAYLALISGALVFVSFVVINVVMQKPHQFTGG